MDNGQLVERIRAGESGYMLQLWEQNKGFIHMMANKYVGGAERDDLEQEGYIALCEAVENYDQDKGMSFINYAAFYIHRRMQMCVDNNRPVRLGYNMGALVRKRKRIASQYASIYGVEPTDKEMRYFLGVTEEMLENIKKASRMGNIASLDAPIETTDGELSVMDVVASDECLEEDVCRRIDRENMKRELWLVVDELPGDLPRVMRLRYQEGLTLDETGERLGVRRSGVRDLQAKAFRLMRTERRGAKLRRYCEEYLHAVTVPHVGIRSFHATWTSEVEREAIKRYEKSRRISRPDSGEGDQKSVPDQEPEGAHFRAFDLPSERSAGVSGDTKMILKYVH